MASAIVTLWVNLVLSGKKSIDEVPAKLVASVKAELANRGQV